MKKLSIKKAWLSACVASIVLIGLTFLVYNFYMKDAVLNLEVDSNTSNATYIKTMLDDTWDDLQELSTKRYYDSKVMILAAAETLEDYRRLGAYSLMIDLKNEVLQNQFVEDIMYYYPETDYVVGRHGVYPSKTYWLASYYAVPLIEYNQWKTELFSPTQTEMFLVDGEQEHGLYLRVCRVQQPNDRVLVIKVNAEEVEKRLGWVNQNSQNSFVAVTDKDGYVYSCVGNAEAFVTPQANQLLAPDSQYILTQLDASVEGLQYVSISEKSQVFHLSSNMIPIAAVLLIAACCISITIAYFLIRLYTRPIELIANVFQDSAEQQQNELEIIDVGIKGLLRKQEELLGLANQQQFVLYQSFLNELFFQNPHFGKNVETVAAFYGLSLTSDYYCVVACRRNADVSNDRIIEELTAWNDTIDVYWTEKDGIDIFLLNFDAEDTAVAESFACSLAGISQGSVEIASSAMVDSHLLITDCWIECAKKLRRADLLPKKEKSIQNSRNQKERILEELTQSLEKEDYVSIQQMAPMIFDICINNADQLSFECNKYNIVRILLPQCPDSMRETLKELAQTGEKEKWVSIFRYVLAVCSSRTRKSTNVVDNDVALNVRRIIDLQYNNPALDLRMISEMVGFSQPYVSKLFKEKYSTGISQYINQVRIEHAKEMILNGSDNIKAVALKVGFAGDTQFIRAFKRIENVTPGSLRSNVASTGQKTVDE